MRRTAGLLVAIALMVGCGADVTFAQGPPGAPPPPPGPSQLPPGVPPPPPGAPPRFGAPPPPGGGLLPSIAVLGTGKASARPDTALALVGAEVRAASMTDATAEAARRMTAVLDRVKALGVAARDITTVTYSVDPVYAPQVRNDPDLPPRIVGYRVANIVQLKVRDLDAVGRILDAALAAGANSLRSLAFTVDDPARVQAEARARAVADAAARARQLADAAGVKLGELLLMSEGPSLRPVIERQGRLLAHDVRATAAMAPGPVETGEQEMTVTVEAHYRIAR
jgi:uncharacterized protein YggE